MPNKRKIAFPGIDRVFEGVNMLILLLLLIGSVVGLIGMVICLVAGWTAGANIFGPMFLVCFLGSGFVMINT